MDIIDGYNHVQGLIQGLVKGDHKFFWLIFVDSAQQSCVNEVSPYWPGPGPTLGPWKLLGSSLLNMHSLYFGVPFYTIFEK